MGKKRGAGIEVGAQHQPPYQRERTDVMDPAFFLTYRDAPPDPRFDGYAFVDADLVLGRSGAEAFYRERTNHITPGEDGCYITVLSKDGRTLIGVDFNGYKRLFVYRSGGAWAVSTSFARLVDFARESSLPQTVLEWSLAASRISGSLTGQLSSFKTCIAEIEMCPTNFLVEITPTGPEFRRLSFVRSGSYEDLLARALSEWSGRIKTVLKAGIIARVALTGGIDSRAVASFFLWLKQNRNDYSVEFNSGGNVRQQADLGVARRLASKYDLRLNRMIPTARFFTGVQAFLTWRETCLGNYFPIRMPPETSYLNTIQFGGNGGEAHRKFYPYESLECLTDSYERRFQSKSHYLHWKENTIASGEKLCPRGADPVLFHYQEFRNRLHAGVPANYQTTVSPLASRLFLECSRTLSKAHIERRQLLFDIMENLVPGIMREPYEVPNKLPSAEVVNSITRVGYQPTDGRVFGDLKKPTADVYARDKFGVICDEFEKAAAGKNLKSQDIKAARQQLEKIRWGTNVPRETRPIHHVFLEALIR